MTSVLGVDSSTQSTKVELRDTESGRVIAVGRGAHPPTTPPRSEQQPDAWWTALSEALAEVHPHLHEVGAISVAGQQHGLVLLDDQDQPLRPAKLWNDTESAPQAAALIELLQPGGWASACGSVPTASFTITKLAWVLANEPEIAARVHRIMLPHDYLTWRLTGRHVTDRGDASGTGWWSPASGDYDRDLLDLVGDGAGLLDLLPSVLGPVEKVGVVEGMVATELGLPADVIVGPGTGDNMAGALGLGLESGDVAISIGTSGTVYGVSSTPTHDSTGVVAGFADASGKYLPLVCTLNATKVSDAVARLLGVDHQTLDRLALAASAGSGGVVVTPYFDGERTPNRPNASGSVTGLRSDVERPQLARAAFEGVVCGLLDGLDTIQAAGVATGGRRFLIGGGARSEAYRRVTADLSGSAIVVPEADETVATGACVQAAAVAEGAAPSTVARRWGLGEGVVVEPRTVDRASVRSTYRARAAAAAPE